MARPIEPVQPLNSDSSQKIGRVRNHSRPQSIASEKCGRPSAFS